MEYLRLQCPSRFHHLVVTQLVKFTSFLTRVKSGFRQSVMRSSQNRMTCVRFIVAKTRINPCKPVSITRLELQAAHLSARLFHMVSKCLDLKSATAYFWTDNTTVLKYLRNEKTRFNVFVANRVGAIRELTKVSDWLYVSSGLNPADDGSRGVQSDRWIYGPSFLREERSLWPAQPDDVSDNLSDDEEVKKVSAVQPEEKWDPDVLFKRYSSWYRLTKAVCWLRRFCAYVKDRRAVRAAPLTQEEMRKSEMAIVMALQRFQFANEYEKLKRAEQVAKRSPLLKLRPFYSEGLIRTMGRLQNADLP